MSINNVNAVSDGLKYVNGLEVCPEQTNIVQDVKDSIFNPVTLAFGGFETYGALKSASGATKMSEIPSKLAAKAENVKGLGLDAFKTENIKNSFKNSYDDIAKMADDAAKKAAEKAAKSSTKTGFFASIGKAFGKAKETVSGLFKSAGQAIGKTGFGTAVKKFFTDGAGKGIAKIAGKAGKLFKGTGAVGMMAIEGVIGIFTDVIPAFQAGGAESGFKQIGKTAVKTAGSGAGWAVGSWAGAAIGGAIGSVFPGVGNAVGAAVGKFLGGIVGSIIGGGIGKKLAGKSEVEKIQEEQINQQAQMVAQDTASMNELNALVAQQVQTDIANGNVTKDTEKMAEYLNNGAYNVSFTGVNQVNYTTPTTTSTATNTNYWNQIAQSIQSGDTSIYNISDDQLNALFTKIPTSYGATNSQVVEDDGKVNYFAVG